MIRFFARLAIAALADWLTWQISTPEMRFRRVTRKHCRQFGYMLEAATPLVEKFATGVHTIAIGFERIALEWEIK